MKIFNSGKNKKNSKTGAYVVMVAGLFNFLVLFFIISASSGNDQMRDRAFSGSADRQGSVKTENADKTKDPYISRNPNIPERIDSPIVNGNDPSLGADEALVNLVVFSDFDCDFCRRQYKVVKNIADKYKDKVKLIWKEYPSRDRSSESWLAGLAARCAYDQGGFWRYADELFHQNGRNFYHIAESAGLDPKRFKSCMKSSEAARALERNIYEGDSLKISGVPYIFVNDKEILGGLSGKELERMIELEIKGGMR